VTDGRSTRGSTGVRSAKVRRFRRPLLSLMSVLYVTAGVMHFVVPGLYVQIVPPVLPAPLLLVYLSGVVEVAVGLGLVYRPTRRPAAWATVLLLIAVFPANVYMATSGVVVEGAPGGGDPSTLARWARLPLQLVLIAWAYWYTTPPRDA